MCIGTMSTYYNSTYVAAKHSIQDFQIKLIIIDNNYYIIEKYA